VSLASSSLRIADQMGLFEKHGLRPRFIRLDSASLTTTALAAGSVDFAVGGVTDLVAARLGGQQLITSANLYKGYANFLVLSNSVINRLAVSKDAPAADRIKALDGLLIAGTSATSVGTLGVKATSLAAGAHVRFTYMTQENMPTSLDSGVIQGYIAATPAWEIPVLRGTATLWLSGLAGDFPKSTSPGTASLLMVRSDFARDNPDLIDAVASILSEFSKVVKDDPDIVKTAVRKLYPDLDPRILDIYFKNEARGWDGTPLTAEDMRREMNFLRVSEAMPAQKLDSLDPASAIYQPAGRRKQ
jgi:ABC-type nitrate/sulfonate/bicarbonate transport system substrate-binding protein